MSDTTAPAHVLTLERVLKTSPDRVWRAWTEPELLMQWFCPRPWRVSECTMDLKVGGTFYTLMQGPDGQSFPNNGVFLEIVPGRKLVFTDAYTRAWVPSAKPFMTAVIELSPHADGTLYVAHALHWSEADRQQHEQMGFHDGWGKAADQLLEVAQGL